MEGDRAATARWRALAVIIPVAAALTIRVALNLSPDQAVVLGIAVIGVALLITASVQRQD